MIFCDAFAVAMLSCIALTTGSRLNKNPELEKKLLDSKVYNRHNRPVKDPNTKVNVSLCLAITHIEEVDQVQQTITFHGNLHLIWIDEYLQWDPSDYGSTRNIHIKPYSIWKPDIALFNGGKNSPWNINSWRFPVVVSSSGTVFLSQTFSFTVTCNFDFTNYPYDIQRCPIILGSWFYSIKDLKLTVSKTANCEKKFVSLSSILNTDKGLGAPGAKLHVAGWELLNSTFETKAYDDYEQRVIEPKDINVFREERYMTVLKFWVKLGRHDPYFGVTDVLPMVITALLTLLSFWVDTHSVCLGLLLMTVLLEAIFGWEMLETMPRGNGELPKIIHLYGINFCLTGVVFLLHIIFQQIILHLENEPIPEFANTIFGRFGNYKAFEQEGLNFDPQSIMDQEEKSEKKSEPTKDDVENQEDAGNVNEDIVEKVPYAKYTELLYFGRRVIFYVLVVVYIVVILADVL